MLARVGNFARVAGAVAAAALGAVGADAVAADAREEPDAAFE